MLITLLGILTSLLAALPAILKRFDVAQQDHINEGASRARQDSRLLDTVLRPKP